MTLQKVTIYADWRTEPEIKPLQELIIIQDGKAEIGRIVFEKDEWGDAHIAHPQNQHFLNFAATEFIKKNKPDLFRSDVAVHIICPEELANRCDWS